MTATAQPTRFVGRRHSGDCTCGCHRVVGLQGEIVQDSDTSRLAEIGLVYAVFDPPRSAVRGPRSARREVVAYSLDEIAEASQ